MGEEPVRARTHNNGLVYSLHLKGEWPSLYLMLRRVRRVQTYHGVWYMCAEWRIWRDKKTQTWQDALPEQRFQYDVLWNFINYELWLRHPKSFQRDLSTLDHLLYEPD